MSATTTQRLTLEEFLKLPETKPASEYINGKIIGPVTVVDIARWRKPNYRHKSCL